MHSEGFLGDGYMNVRKAGDNGNRIKAGCNEIVRRDFVSITDWLFLRSF